MNNKSSRASFSASVLEVGFSEQPENFELFAPILDVSGRAGGLDANVEALYNLFDTSEKMGIGAGGNLGAFGLAGEATVGARIGIIDLSGTLGGTLYSAHIGADGGVSWNPQTGKLNAGFGWNIGLSGGVKVGGNIGINIGLICPSCISR